MDKRGSTSSIEEVNSSIESIATDESIEDPREDATVDAGEEDKSEKRASTGRQQTRLPARLRDPAFMLNRSMDTLEAEMRDNKFITS